MRTGEFQLKNYAQTFHIYLQKMKHDMPAFIGYRASTDSTGTSRLSIGNLIEMLDLHG